MCDFGEHTRTARCVKSEDMPLRGMSSHTAARYCRVICGWGSAATSTHENENPAASNFAQGLDMPRETATPAAACSSIAENVPRRLPSGWPSARHACLALVVPSAYREVLPCSRTASCSACAPGRSQPCYSSQSPFVGLVRSGALVKKTRNGKGPRGSSFHRPGAFRAAMDAP